MELIDKIFEIINKENIYPNNLTDKDKYLLFCIYVLTCDVYDIDDKFLYLQNQMLKNLAEKKSIDFNEAVKKKNVIDEYSVKTDLLILFTNNVISSANSPYFKVEDLNMVDNRLLLEGGVQLKQELYRLYEKNGFIINYYEPYIVRSDVMNVKYVMKIAIDNKCSIDDSYQKLINALHNSQEKIEELNINNAVVKISNIDESFLNNKKIIKNIKKTILKSLKNVIFI